MSSIFPCSVRIVDNVGRSINVEELCEFEIHLSRGTDPSTFTVVTSDDRFDETWNPVSIEIRAPGPDHEQKIEKKLVLNDWYQVMKRPADAGRWAVTFADKRWRADFEQFTGHFNMQWSNSDVWENESFYIPAGASVMAPGKWTCVGAAEYAMHAFGLKPDKKHDISQESMDALLPPNLGNTESGGFVGAKMAEVFPRLLGKIRADIIITPEGKCRIVGRSWQNSRQGVGGMPDMFKLNDLTIVSGAVGKRDIKWQIPSRIVCLFEQKIERLWYYEEPLYLVDPVSGFALNQLGSLVNVAPSNIGADPDDRTDFRFIGTVISEASGFLSPSDALYHMARYMLTPDLFPDGSVPLSVRSAAGYRDRIEEAETIARGSWRRLFQVKFFGNDGDWQTRACSRIRLGRLSADGGTRAGGGVISNFVIIHDNLKDPSLVAPALQDLNKPFLIYGTLSTNVEFGLAPFQAVWTDQTQLVFALVPRNNQRGVRTVHPGKLYVPIGFRAEIDAVESGSDVLHVTVRDNETNGFMGFDRNFKMGVFWNGHIVKSIGPAVPRLFEQAATVATPGFGPTLYIHVPGITANWSVGDMGTVTPSSVAAVANGANLPGTLLNASEIYQRANQEAERLIQSYQQDYSGIAVMGGIHCITDGGVITSGPIHDTVIHVGAFDPWTITTEYAVIPEFRPGDAPDETWKGAPIPKVL